MMLYCNWLSRSEGRTPCYRLGTSDDQVGTSDFRADGYRLPTEAEWEHAFRDGTTTEYVTGDDVERLLDYAVLFGSDDGGPPRTRLPNTWGLFDLPANQWEVCWGAYPVQPGGVVLNPSERSPQQFVAKGGSASGGLHYLGASFRLPYHPRDLGGFRVVRGPHEPAVGKSDPAMAAEVVRRALERHPESSRTRSLLRSLAGDTGRGNQTAETRAASRARAEERRSRVGPIGSGIGVEFADQELPQGARVVGVKVRHGSWIDGIELLYKTADGKEEGLGWHGGNGGVEDTFRLEEDEFITAITGKAGVVIRSLTIVTNKRKSRTYGGDGGDHAFELRSSDGEVAGFCGRCYGALNQLGFFVSKSSP